MHIVNWAFKYGATKSGWNLDSLLRSLHRFFADSAARSQDYSRYAKSGTDVIFQLRFCGTRWLEDVSVAQRAIHIWQDIVKYLNASQKLSNSRTKHQ